MSASFNFGGATGQSSKDNNTPTTSMPSLFGTSGTTAPTTSTTTSSNLFGAGTPSAPALSFGSLGSTTGAATFKPGDAKPNLFAQPAGASTNLFGSATNTSSPAAGAGLKNMSNLFGNTTPTSPAPGVGLGAATPAKPMFAMNSTTPAGAPPANPSSTGGLFAGKPGGAQQPTEKPLFASTGAAPAASSGGNLFSGLSAGGSQTSGAPSSTLFGAKSADMSTTPTAPLGGGLFGSKPAEGAAGENKLGAATTAATAATAGAPAASSFGNLGGAMAAKPAASSNLFGSLGGAATTAPAATTTAAMAPPPAAASSGLFGGLKAPSAPTATTEAAKPANSLFGAAPPAGTPAATTAARPANSLFGAAPAAATTASTAAATAETPKPATTGLFGAVPASSATAASMTASTTATKPTETPSATTTAAAATTLGASTMGPSSSLARLKNKTMDEILTRWASELSTYQTQFSKQAAQVALWDRLLVSNGQQIQDLYLSTFEAEKASREVERGLLGVEAQQDELEAWLDRYEGEVEGLFGRDMSGRDAQGGGGVGGGVTGPDQERERTYRLAGKVAGRLEEWGRDLGKLVEEVNEAAGGLGGRDDVLTQIIRVLNGHLAQLQWIDNSSTALQAKVNAARKAGAVLGSQYGNGAESDVTESFYRSYMARK